MVKVIITQLLLFLLSSTAMASDFVASVNKKELSLGESLVLTLTLSDEKANGQPDISKIKNDFTIHSQQQSSSNRFVNGAMSSSVSWSYTLMAKKVGRVTIPPISLATKGGKLTTKPIEVEIVKQATGKNGEQRGGARSDRITLTSSLSNAFPYKGEPINYSVKLISKEDIVNLRIGKLEMDDAIVEMVEEPEVKDRVIDGVRVKTLEVNTLITPLKEGALTIPPIVIQGGFPSRERSRLRSLFDDDFDPFDMMGGFGRVEPFALATEEVTLDVLPEVPSVVPWLPARSIEIKEKWDDSKPLEVGEPTTIAIEVKGIGVRASQLPEIKRLFGGRGDFKIYADKPESEEKIVDHDIHSYRKELLTLIPMKEGRLTLPAVEIPWWDVKEKEAKVARLEKRVVDVKASSKAVTATPPPPVKSSAEPAQELSEQGAAALQENTPSYIIVLIGALLLLLLLTFFWILSLQRKIKSMASGEVKSEKKGEQHPPTSRELAAVSSPKELFLFLQSTVKRGCEGGKMSTSDEIYQAMASHLPGRFHGDLAALLEQVDRALYKGEELDLPQSVEVTARLLKNWATVDKKGGEGEKLPDLNPR